MNQELSDYIKKFREAGQSDEQIKGSLLAAGWKKEDVNLAFSLTSVSSDNLAKIANDISIVQAPKWLLLIFKFYGALLLISITLSSTITLSTTAVLNPKFLSSSTMMVFYGVLITAYIIGFGTWGLKNGSFLFWD